MGSIVLLSWVRQHKLSNDMVEISNQAQNRTPKTTSFSQWKLHTAKSSKLDVHKISELK